MKRFSTVLLLFSMECLYAVAPEKIPALTRHAGVFASALSASYIALSPVDLPGVSIEKNGSFIPDRIVLESADLGSFPEYLLKRDGMLGFIPLSIMRPLAESAAGSVRREGINREDFMVSGEIEISRRNDIPAASILSGNTESLDLVIAFDVLIHDRIIDADSRVSGKVRVSGSGERRIAAECISLASDGVQYGFSPVLYTLGF